MKKRVLMVFISIFIVFGLVGCSGEKESKTTSGEAKENTLKVGAATVPHAEILEKIKPKLKEKGIELEIITLDDDGQLNPSLKEKQIDANYFQHLPYLESVAEEKGFDFEVAGKIHVEPIGLYSKKIIALSELKEGSKIAIPNDPSNEYRALELLQKNGIIKLKSDLKNYSATPSDIIENPKKIEFVEAEAALLPRALDDVTAAIINTNRVLEAKIPLETAIIREDKDSPYANIVVVRKGETERKEIKALIEVLTTDEVKNFIKEKYGVAVVPAF